VPNLAPNNAASVPRVMFSTQRESALTVMIRTILSAKLVPLTMNLHYLERVLNALQDTDLQMVSVFFATKTTPVKHVLSMSARDAWMVPDF